MANAVICSFSTIIFFLLSGQLSAQLSAEFSYYKEIAIQASQVSGASNLINFTMLFSEVDPDLRTVPNGGRMQNANGYDIQFAKSDGFTVLDHEVESYDPVTGELNVWVKVDTVFALTNTTIRIYYGASTIATDFSTSTTWDNNYQAVWHFDDNTDASPTGADLTNSGSLNSTNAVIGTSQNFNEGTFYQTGVENNLNIAGNLTLESWVNLDVAFTENYANTIISGAGGDPDVDFPYYFNIEETAGTYQLGLYWVFGGGWSAGDFEYITSGNLGVTLIGSWHHFAVTRDVDNDMIHFYVNGNLIASQPYSNTSDPTPSSGNHTVKIGESHEDVATERLDGKLDEARISNVLRTPEWMETNYASMSSPATFYNLSAEVVCDGSFSYALDSYCQSSSDPTAAITGTPGGVFSEATGDIVFLNTATGRIDVSASTIGGPYEIIYTTPALCRDTFLLSIIELVSTAGRDVEICTTTGTGSTILNANDPSPHTGEWFVTPAHGSFVDVNDPNTTFTGNDGWTYELEWQVSSGTCFDVSDVKYVTINSSALDFTADAGLDIMACGPTASLDAVSPPGGVTGTWDIISGIGGTVASLNSETSSFTGIVGNSYALEWMLTDGGCESRDTVSVTFDNSLGLTADAGSDQNVCSNSATLSGNTAGGATYIWEVVSGSGVIASSFSSTTGVTNLSNGNNVFKYTLIDGGCTSIDTLLVNFDSASEALREFGDTWTFPAGSYIIPMDNTNQAGKVIVAAPPEYPNGGAGAGIVPFNLRSYGLVNELLQNDIPVYWAIKSGKGKDGIDISANVDPIYPNSTFVPSGVNRDFVAGPFVVHVSDVPAADPIITAFNAAHDPTYHDDVKVFETNNNEIIEFRHRLTFKPAVLLLDNGGEKNDGSDTWQYEKHSKILSLAGMTSAIVDTLSAIDVSLDANSCYSFASEPHWKDGEGTFTTDYSAAGPEVDRIRAFVEAGGNFLTQCAGIEIYENEEHFHTTLGMLAGANKAAVHDELNFDEPWYQINGILENDPTGTYVGIVPGGGGVYQPGLIVNVEKQGDNAEVLASIKMTPAGEYGGYVTYLGGHDYRKKQGDDKPYDISFVNGLRIYLNAVLVPPRRSACPDMFFCALSCDASFTYATSSYCTTDTDPIPTITGDALGFFKEPFGNVVFVDTLTGEIDLSASTLGGPYDIIYTSPNACSDTFQITISGAPTISCPSDSTVIADGSCEYILPDFTALAVVTSGCGGITVNQTPLAGTNLNAGIHPIALSVQDGNGNVDTCYFNFNVKANAGVRLIDCGTSYTNETTVGNGNITDNYSCGGGLVGEEVYYQIDIPPGNYSIAVTIENVFDTDDKHMEVMWMASTCPVISCFEGNRYNIGKQQFQSTKSNTEIFQAIGPAAFFIVVDAKKTGIDNYDIRIDCFESQIQLDTLSSCIADVDGDGLIPSVNGGANFELARCETVTICHDILIADYKQDNWLDSVSIILEDCYINAANMTPNGVGNGFYESGDWSASYDAINNTIDWSFANTTTPVRGDGYATNAYDCSIDPHIYTFCFDVEIDIACQYDSLLEIGVNVFDDQLFRGSDGISSTLYTIRDSLSISGNTTIGGCVSSDTLSVNDPYTTASYLWGTVDGNIVMDTDTTYIVLDAPGTYFVQGTINGCTEYDTVIVLSKDLITPIWDSLPSPLSNLGCSDPLHPQLDYTADASTSTIAKSVEFNLLELSYCGATDSDSINAYAVLARKTVHFHGVTTTNGGLGVFGSGEGIRMHEGSNINSFVRATKIDNTQSTVATSYNTSAPDAYSELNFKSNFTPSGIDTIIMPGVTAVVYGNNFDRIEIGAGADVTFASESDIYADEFITQDASVGDTTFVRFENCVDVVTNELDIGKRNFINPVSSMNDTAMVIFHATNESVNIDESTINYTNIYAPFGSITVKEGTVARPGNMTGLYVADQVSSGRRVSWNFRSSCSPCRTTPDPCSGYDVTYIWTATDTCGLISDVRETFRVLPDTLAPIFDVLPSTISDITCGDPLPIQEVVTATDDCSSANVLTFRKFQGALDTCNSDNPYSIFAYTMLVSKEIQMDESVVNFGDVGIYRPGGIVKVHNTSAVNTTVRSPFVETKNGSTVSSYSSTTAPDPLQRFPLKYNRIPSGIDSIIPPGSTVNIYGNDFDKIEIGQGATVIFHSTTDIKVDQFEVKNTSLGNETTLIFNTCIDIIANDQIKIGDFSVINPSSNGEINRVTFHSSEKNVEIGKSVLFNANINAPYRDIKVANSNIASPTKMTGLFIAEKIEAGENSEWSYSVDCALCEEVEACQDYEVEYIWVAIDECGNYTELTRTFKIFGDKIAPTFDSPPASIADLVCTDVLPPQEILTASDDCDGAVTVNMDTDFSSLYPQTCSNDDTTSVFGYTMLAKTEIKMDNSSVLKGGVGVYGTGVVDLNNFAAIYSYAHSPTVTFAGGSLVNKTKIGTAPDPALVILFKSNPKPGLVDTIIADGAVADVYGSQFRRIEIGKGATVTFHSEDDIKADEFIIKDADLGTTTTVQFTSCPDIVVTRTISLGKRSIVNPSNAEGEIRDVNFHTDDNGNVDIKEGSTIQTSIFAPNGTINTSDALSSERTKMVGLFVADKINAKDFVEWKYRDQCDFCHVPVRCDGYIVDYTWTAYDSCGNEAIVTQSFKVEPDTIPAFYVVPPPIYADVSCRDIIAQDSFPYVENCAKIVNQIMTVDIRELSDSCTSSNPANVNAYTILAKDNIQLNWSDVNSGGVGMWKDGGGRTIYVHDSSSVTSFVQGDILNLNNGSTAPTFTSAKAPDPTLSIPFKTNPFNTLVDTVIAAYDTVVIYGNNFGKIEIGKGAYVKFNSSDDIFVREWITKDNESDEFSVVLFENCVDVIVKEKFDVGQGSIVNNPTEDGLVKQITFHVNILSITGKVAVDKRSYFSSNIYAPNEIIEVRGLSNSERTKMHGQFIGQEVISSNYVDWDYNENCSTCVQFDSCKEYEMVYSWVLIDGCGTRTEEVRKFLILQDSVPPPFSPLPGPLADQCLGEPLPPRDSVSAESSCDTIDVQEITEIVFLDRDSLISFDKDSVYAYTILSRYDISMSETQVLEGGVGIWDTGGDADIDNNSSINTFLRSSSMTIDVSATVNTTYGSQAPDPTTRVPKKPYTGTAPQDTIIADGVNVDVYGNDFGKITVGKGSKVTFHSTTDIHVEDFEIKDSDPGDTASVCFVNNINVVVNNNFIIGKRSVVNPPDSLNNSKDIAFHLYRNGTIKESVIFNGDINANGFNLSVDNALTDYPTALTGLFIADDISSGEHVNWSFNTRRDPFVWPTDTCNFRAYEVSYIWTAEDKCGNYNEISRSFEVHPDTMPPTFTVPADITVYLNTSCIADTSIAATGDVTDEAANCLILEEATYTDSIYFVVTDLTIDRKWQLVNMCGDTVIQVQVITVLDTNSVNAIVIPSDTTIYNDALCFADTTTIAVGDVIGFSSSCDSLMVATYRDEVTMPCDGSMDILREWTITDTLTMTVVFVDTQYIYVRDTLDPSFILPADITVYRAADCSVDTSIIVTLLPTALNDNCDASPSATYTDITGSTSCDGQRVITRRWTVMDDCGNSSFADQTITITDTISPTFTVPNDTTIYLNVACAVDTTTAGTGDVTDESDGCTVLLDANYSDAIVSGCGSEFVVSRTWTLSDDCGNTTIRVQTISVEDTLAPTFTAPNDTLLYQDATCSADTSTVSTGHVLDEDDNCSTGLNAIYSDFSSVSNDTLIIERRWSLTDVCGNIGRDTQIIKLYDNSPPVLTIPNDTTLYADINCLLDTTTADIGIAVITDCNSAIPATYWDSTVVICPGTMTIYRHWTAIDSSSNEIRLSQIIDVSDTIAPTFTVPNDTILYRNITCTADTTVASAGDVTDEADGCSTGLDATFADVVTYPCMGEMVVSRTWNVTDNCGNTAPAQVQTITVRDTTKPSFVTPADATVYFDNSCNVDTTTTDLGVATILADNCDATLNAIYNDIIVSASSFKRVWSVVDDCGNIQVDTQYVALLDTISPIISCPGEQTVVADAACEHTIPDLTSLGSYTDNCDNGSLTISQNPIAGTLVNAGVQEIQLYVTDNAGNSDTCVFDYVVLGDVSFKNVVCGGSYPNETTVGTGSFYDNTSCATATPGGDQVYQLTVPPGNYILEVVLDNVTDGNDSHVEIFWMYDECPMTSCPLDAERFNISNARFSSTGNNSVAFNAPGPGTYFVIIDSETDGIDQYDVSFNCLRSGIIYDNTGCAGDTGSDGKELYVDGTSNFNVENCQTIQICHDIHIQNPLDFEWMDSLIIDLGSCFENIRGMTPDGGPGFYAPGTWNAVYDPVEHEVVWAFDHIGSYPASTWGDGYTGSYTCANGKPNMYTFCFTAEVTAGCSDSIDLFMAIKAIDDQFAASQVTTLSGDVVISNELSLNALSVDAGSDLFVCNGDSIQLAGLASGGTYLWKQNGSVSDVNDLNTWVTPTTNSQYILEASNGSGCVQRDTMNVTVGNKPISGITGNTIFNCISDSLFVTNIVAGVIYNWTTITGNITSDPSLSGIEIDQEGKYYLQSLATNGCTSLDSISIFNDAIPPSFSIPSDTTLYVDVNCIADTSIAVTGAAFNQLDNIDASPLTTYLDDTTKICSGTYTIERIWMVTDDCGNSDSQSQFIDVIDTIGPTFIWPIDQIVYMDASCVADTSIATNGSVLTSQNDNCDLSPTVAGYVDVVSNLCGGTYQVERQWTMIDDCGNATTNSQSITVLDTLPPTFTVPNDTTIYADASCVADTSSTGDVLDETDNCSTGLDATFSDVASVLCIGGYTVTRTWSLVDACGNAAKDKVQTIFVIDTISPTFTIPPDITIYTNAVCVYDDSPTNTGNVSDETDNCSTGLKAKYSDAITGSCDSVCIISRTWLLTDGCGNSASGIQIITVEDTISPQFIVPIDVTLYSAAGCAIDTTTTNTGTISGIVDNCDPSLIGNYVDAVTNTCAGEYSVERTWTVTDKRGNTRLQIQTISVFDTIAPSFTPLNDTTLYVDALCFADTTVSGTGDVLDEMDNCSTGIEATYSDIITNICTGSYTITRTWTLSDDCGNTVNELQTIAVLDTIKPTFTAPADATIYADASCTADTTTTGTVVDETDNCSIGLNATYTDVVSTSCVGSYTLTRTWNLVDDCGNAAAAQVQIIQIVDTIKPTFTIPADITIYSDGVCGYDDSPLNTGDSSNEADNCSTGLKAKYADAITGSCDSVCIITRTWLLTDGCGNSASGVQIITVEDTISPTFIVPNDTLIYSSISCSVDTTVAIAGDITIPMDNCDVSLDTSYTDATVVTCPGNYVVERTWTVTDNNGNSSSQLQTITVIDTLAPTFTVPADILLYSNATCTVDTTVAATGDVIDESDNCTTVLDATYSDFTTNTCAGSFTITRTWRLEDACNNSTIAVQTITVLDTIKPSFTRPVDITIYADATCNNDVSVAGDVTDESDNCSSGIEATFTDVVSPTCVGSFTITRTWTLADACSNAAADQVQIITVIDTLPPTFTTPADITIYSDVSCLYDDSPLNTGDVMDAADNCTAVLKAKYSDSITGSCDSVCIISRTWLLTDGCGNDAMGVQLITVVDTISPSFVVPVDTTIYSNISCSIDTSVTIAGTISLVSDNCDISLDTSYTDSTIATCPGNYVVERTWTVTDNNGNSSSQMQTITVIDTIPPTFTTPSDTTIYADANCIVDIDTATIGGVNDETDNCSTGLDATYSDFVTNVCPGSYTVTRTWTLDDACNNTIVDVQTITILDTIRPTFTAPADQTIYSDAACLVDISVTAMGDVSDEADNCSVGLDAVFSDNTTPSCTGSYVITRTWSLVDDCGNSAADQIQTITVLDTIKPSFTAPVDITIYPDGFCSYKTGPGTTGDVSDEADNCSTGIQATYSDAIIGQCDSTCVITRTWTLSDNCGNTASAIQTITVIDTISPVFTLPPDQTVYTSVSCVADTTLADIGSPTGLADNCDPSLDVTYLDVITTTCTGSFTFDRIWTVTDNRGNSTIQTQSITVLDTIRPSFTPLADITVYTDISCIVDIDTATIGGVNDESDNCSTGLDATYSDIVTNVCDGSYTVARTWTLTDDCSNTTIALQTITVLDTIRPTFTAPADQTIYSDALCAADISVTAMGDVTDENDNCTAVLDATFSDVTTSSCTGSFVITRTWSLIDNCGNSALDQVQTITVLDTIKPTFTIPSDITLYPDGFCAIDTTVTKTGDITDESDNCSTGIQATYSDAIIGQCDSTCVITRTWTLSDNCGNTASAIQTITVIDTISPVFSLPPDQTVYTSVSCTADTTLVDIGSPTGLADNCDPSLDVTYLDVSTTTCTGSFTFDRIWTVTDNRGNSTIQTQSITVLDTIRPSFTPLADITVYTDISCIVDIDTATIGGVNDESDNCSTGLDATYSDIVTNVCDGSYTVARTWTLTDDCSNTTIALQTITVLDTIKPTFTAPVDQTIYSDALCAADISVAAMGDVTDENDNCTAALDATFNDVTTTSCAGSYVITRTWSLVDVCGNTSPDQIQTITVLDTIKPTFTTPVDITIYQDGFCGVDFSTTGAGDVTDESDNCSTGLQATYIDNTLGQCDSTCVITRTWILSDDCGNTRTGIQTITVVDTTAPVFVAPLDQTVYSTSTCVLDTTTIDTGMPSGLADNCDPNLDVDYQDVISTNCTGDFSIERIWTVTDTRGNTTTSSQVITVLDTISPSFTVPADTTVYSDLSCIVNIDTASVGTVRDEWDNCSNTLDASFSDLITNICSGSYLVRRTWNLSDDCGNTITRIQTIIVQDTIKPTFTTPTDHILYYDASCSADTTATALGQVIVTSENCTTTPSVTYVDNVVIDCGAAMTVARLWTITDDCGNSDTHTQIIQVLDTIAPTYDSPPGVSLYVDASDNVDTAVVAAGAIQNINDNCSVVTIIHSDSVATINAGGIVEEIYRNWTFTDDCGNVTGTTQIITVIDTFPPPAVIPPTETVDCDQIPPVDTMLIFPDLSDIEDIEMIETRIDTPCVDRYTIVRSWTATNPNGVETTVEQVIVIDNCPNEVIGVFTNESTGTSSGTGTGGGGTGPGSFSTVEICEGELAELTSTFSTPLSVAYSPQWYFRQDTTFGWSAIPAANDTAYSFQAFTFRTGWYKVVYNIDASHSDDDICGWHSNEFNVIVRQPSPRTYISDVMCDGGTYVLGDSTFTERGDYLIFFQNIYGCDSIVDLRLEVYPVHELDINIAICDGDYYETAQNVRYYSANTFVDTLTSSLGCDSILTVILDIIPRDYNNVTEYICSGSSFMFGGQALTIAGTYRDTLIGTNTCDSVVILDLVVMPDPTRTTVPINICVGTDYMFNGNTYNTNGTFYDTLTSVYGCDSIIITELQLDTTIIHEIFDTICFGGSYVFNGTDYSTSGAYQYLDIAATGCDSVTTLFLLVRADYTSNLNIQICEGEVFNYNSKTFDTQGSFDEQFTAASGCDSTVTLNLVVVDTKTSTQSINLCSGDSILLDGTYEKTSGTVTRNLFTDIGCDSIVTYVIDVAILEESDESVALCSGDSILIGGNYIKQSGSYQEVLQSQLTGCDSIKNYIVDVEANVALVSNDITVCAGEPFTLAVDGADIMVWSDYQLLDCRTCPNPSGRLDETRTFTVTAQSCFGSTTTLEVTVNVLDIPSFYMMADTSVRLGDSIMLTMETSDPFTPVDWYDQQGGLLCANCTSVEVSPVQSGFYFSESTTATGCTVRDSVLINLRTDCADGEVIVPNFVSPNGDGVNDEVPIRHRSIQRLGKMRIFNRWGGLVFTSEDPENFIWDGKVDGRNINPGVYVYFLEYYCLNGEQVFKKGSITVLE